MHIFSTLLEARERVTDLEHLEKYATKMVDIFKRCSQEGLEQSVDLQDVFARFTMDAAGTYHLEQEKLSLLTRNPSGTFLFGIPDFNTLDLPLSKPEMGVKGSAMVESPYGGFVTAFETLQAEIPPRAPRGKLWPLWEMFGEVGQEANREVDRFLVPLIEKALRRAKEEKGAGGSDREGSLLDHIVGSTTDERMIRDEVGMLLDFW